MAKSSLNAKFPPLGLNVVSHHNVEAGSNIARKNYVSVNSKSDHLLVQTPSGTKKVLKLHSRGNCFKNSAKKKQQPGTEIMKSSTEMLICLETLKQWNM